MTQPISAVSNILFPIFAIFAFYRAQIFGVYPVYVIVCACALMAGSYAFHATTRNRGKRNETDFEYRARKADEIGMYAYFNSLFGLYVWALTGMQYDWLILIVMTIITVLMGIKHVAYDSVAELGQYYFQLWLLGITTALFRLGEPTLAVWAIIIALLAFLLRAVGEKLLEGEEKGTAIFWIGDTLHGIPWHGGMSASFYFLILITIT